MPDVDLWVKSDIEFFEQIKESKETFFNTLYEMWDFLNTPTRNPIGHEDIINKLNTVSFQNQNHDMILLFLNHWIALDMNLDRNSEAKILLQKAKSFISKNSRKELLGLYYLNEGLVGSILKELKYSEDYYYKKAFESVERDSRLYINFLYQLMSYYSNRGYLADLKIDAPPKTTFTIFFNLKNSFELGDFQSFKIFSNEFKSSNITIGSIIDIAKELIAFVDYYTENKEISLDSPWLLAFKKLRDRDYQGALEISNSIYQDEVVFTPRPTGFGSYTPIRSQLSCGNAQAALVLLKDKKEQKQETYLDHFFIGRALLLLGEKEKSLQHFLYAYQNCKKYGALGRFDLEMELSNELTPSLIRFIMENIFSQTSKKVEIPHTITQPEKPMLAKKIIGISDVSNNIKDTILSYANLDIPILILGETGVGKDLTAQSIHEASERSKEPFLAINCGAISPNLLQSELFGHVKGSFSGATQNHKGFFETAGLGTVFLDEIGEITPDLQIALLRVLEKKEFRPVGSATVKPYHCRVIAATNAPLENLVQQGTFRKDLYYRLKRFTLEIPPLRERQEDIKPLTKNFLQMGFANDSTVDCDENLWNALVNYSWPGNIRELKNEIEKMRILNSHISVYKLKDAVFLKSKENLTQSTFQKTTEEIKDTSTNTNDIEKQVLDHSNKNKFRRLEKIRILFRKNKRLSRMEVCQILGVANQTIGTDFKDLIAEGFLEKIEPTTSPRTHYFILKE